MTHAKFSFAALKPVANNVSKRREPESAHNLWRRACPGLTDVLFHAVNARGPRLLPACGARPASPALPHRS